MKLTELLDQIQRLDQEATDGPWHEDGDEVLGDFYEDHGYLKAPVLGGFYQNECDAEFIALARTALPKLAEAVYHVLELHNRKVLYKSNSGKTMTAHCEHCYESWSQVDRPLMDGEADTFMWPCPTVRAITDALGE